jgi:hypothetical protein
MQRLLKFLRYESQVEALLERVPWDPAETLSEDLRIAELAARAHLRAAADRVPRRICPFDSGPVAHRSQSTLYA